MATLRQLARSELPSLGWPTADVEQRLRRLHGADLIEKQGGPYTRDATPGELALLLLSLASPRAVDAATYASRFAALRLWRENRATKVTLRDELTRLLEAPSAAEPIEALHLSRTEPLAWLDMQASDGDERTRIFQPVRRSSRPSFAISVNVRVSGVVLSQLALDLQEPDESGEWTSHFAEEGGDGTK